MSEIQSKLKAPKSQTNDFGKYKYRSCEDIVEAVKPVLKEYGYHLNMSDEVIGVGNRVYIKATCIVMDGEKEVSKSTALAREAENKKGMDDSQITGTASSYARKYALNGLFAIDDTKDADSNEHHNYFEHYIEALNKAKNLDELKVVYLDATDKATKAKDTASLKAFTSLTNQLKVKLS